MAFLLPKLAIAQNVETLSKVLILETENNSSWKAVSEKIACIFKDKFYDVKSMQIEDFLSNPDALNDVDILIVRFFFACDNCSIYCGVFKAGRRFDSVWGALWNNDLIWDGSRCIKPTEFVREHFSTLVPHLFILDEKNINKWQRASNNLQLRALFEHQII